MPTEASARYGSTQALSTGLLSSFATDRGRQLLRLRYSNQENRGFSGFRPICVLVNWVRTCTPGPLPVTRGLGRSVVGRGLTVLFYISKVLVLCS